MKKAVATVNTLMSSRLSVCPSVYKVEILPSDSIQCDSGSVSVQFKNVSEFSNKEKNNHVCHEKIIYQLAKISQQVTT